MFRLGRSLYVQSSPPRQLRLDGNIIPLVKGHDGFPQLRMSSESESTSVISALGTLIGYIGSEAATDDLFERLLWPQRCFNAFSWPDIFRIGLLNPMGGPMHKAALKTLDRLHQNELFEGPSLGNMLGTAFFYDTNLRYKMQGSPSNSTVKDYVRNGLWVQAIRHIPILITNQPDGNGELGTKPPKLVRARTVVNILELSYTDGKVEPSRTVKNDVGSASIRTLLAIIWSEITGIVMGVFVLAFWNSYFAVIWFLPVALRLLSALTTIKRENLLPRRTAKEDEEEIRQFEVNTYGHGFLLVEGKESTVLQFFRHYGHPIRDRVREIIQIAIIVVLGLLFPVGLLCSLIWMPVGLQYLWLGYQLYATMAMYTYRFTRNHQRTTSPARLAEIFADGKDEARCAYLQDDNGTTVQGKLTRIYVRNYGEGQEVLREYMQRRQGGAPQGEKHEDASAEVGDISGRSLCISTPETSVSNHSELKGEQ